MIETPVILLVFNRPRQTREVFRAIADAQPRRLLIIADGPRDGRPGEEQLCQQVRAIVQDIAWPCEFSTNFSPINLGCGQRVISGLDWAFSLVEEAIVLEDDCVPVPEFFQFCTELLIRYRHDSRVGMISGDNFVTPFCKTDYSYYFSRQVHIWGWATWRRAWKLYDARLEYWDAIKREGLLNEAFARKAEIRYWSEIFQSMRDGTGPDTWDHQWGYTVLVNNLLSVVPAVNLVQNIGFGPDATHTREGSAPAASNGAGDNLFPLRHPPSMIPRRSFDTLEHDILRIPTRSGRVRSRIRLLVSRLAELRAYGQREERIIVPGKHLPLKGESAHGSEW